MGREKGTEESCEVQKGKDKDDEEYLCEVELMPTIVSHCYIFVMSSATHLIG